MTDYKFERFSGHWFRGDTKIAINKSGLIRLSSGFCRKVNVFDYKYVVLFYDSTNRAIALKFTKKREVDAFRITRDRTSATISGKSFLAANSLFLRSYFKRYDWKRETIPGLGEVFIIDLTEHGTNN